MPRIGRLPLLLSAGVATIAVGSYSALAGPGTVANVVPSVMISSEDEPTVRSQSAQVQEGEGSEDAQGADRIAQAIAVEFGVTKEEVLARHNEGIGFGALFKLYKLARAQGISVDE